MNDPNKAIDVNLSSLLSLKAELLRKQAEVSKAKVTQQSADEYVTSRTNTSSTSSSSSSSSSKKDKKQRNKDLNEPQIADTPKVVEVEDSALLEKSKRVLQAKSKFYERMTRTGGKLNSDDNCLVLFNRKQQEEKNPISDPFQEQLYQISSDSELSLSEDEEDGDGRNTDPEEDWVEYTDCLGRTRKCLRKDLNLVKRRDTELAASMPERLDQSKANWMLDTKGTHGDNSDKVDTDNDDDDIPIGPMPTESIYSDGCSLMSKHDEQRANWERKEVENLDKSDVHYQDVFFDEARQHGVGYYAFSTDEEERKRQQNELEEARQQTISEQEHRDTQRAQREKIIAERVRAAKNRQRARLGLPPLEEEVAKPAEQEKESKEERHARKRAEKLKRKQEKAEKEREQERELHIRPWDREKDGIAGAAKTASSFNENDPTEAEWMYKPERLPMSQKEWNEQQRTLRNPEFGPVSPEGGAAATPNLKRKNFSNSNDGSMPPPAVPARARGSYTMVPPPPSTPLSSASYDTLFSNYQSSKRSKQFHRRSYEISNDDDVNHVVEDLDDTDKSRSRAAIPPPANMDPDFTLPSHAKRPKSHNELERSIEAGLRFLRNNSDKSTISSKSTWTAKADY